MSKPNPRLSKGIVRTLAREVTQVQQVPVAAQYPASAGSGSSPNVLTLAPAINASHPGFAGGEVPGSGAIPSASNFTYNNGASSAASSSRVPYGPTLPSTTNNVAGPSPSWSIHSLPLPLPLQHSLSTLGASSYLSLLPAWDTVIPSGSFLPPPSAISCDSIVLPYTYRSTSSSSSSSSHLRSPLKADRAIHSQATPKPTTSRSRRYSSAASSPSSSFLTPSLPPSFFYHDRPLSNPLSVSGPAASNTPSQSSFDELLAALDFNSPFHNRGRVDPQDTYISNTSEPPYHPPPSPGPTFRPGDQPMKPPRPAETHTVLSPAPLSSTDTSNSGGSLMSYPFLATRRASSSAITTPSTAPTSVSATSTHSSSLIFHLGASGLPKERLPPPSSSVGQSRPAAPPRPRTFTLPDITAPPASQFRSIAVGEDAYFARFDGMCIADGVGGWARSGRGGAADPGRWSRLLTHFCEVELGDWWAGAEFYLYDDKTNKKRKVDVGGGAETGKKEGSKESVKTVHRGDTVVESNEGKQWAKDVWASATGKNAKDKKITAATEEGRTRRPLNPVEIMQRGYEKCLACATAEGILGSSTCLLALLHNSTLHIANLGDCCLLLIRNSEIIFRTSEMQHAFNFPLQVGPHSRDEPMKDAMRFDVGVKKGDIVVLGSDGLMDNLFDEDILDVVAQFTTPHEPPMPNLPPTPPSSRPSSSSSSSSSMSKSPPLQSFSTSASSSKPPPPPPPPSSSSSSSEYKANTKPFPPFSPQRVSEALCRRARAVSELVTATTPFMCRAIEEGIDFVGGKKDDISVLVGVVGDGQPEQITRPSGAGADVRGPGALALHT